MTASSKDVESCLERLNGLQAQGGTEMASALVEALMPKDEAAQRQAVLVTDGQISFESETIRELFRSGPVVAPVHAVGIGRLEASVQIGSSDYGEGGEAAISASELQALKARIQELERALGRKKIEVEILRLGEGR